MSRHYSEKTVFPVFSVKKYVKVADEAAKRTRWLTIVLAVASVIILIGIWNSLHWSWATERVKTAFDLDPTHNEKMFDVLRKGSDHELFDKKQFLRDLQHSVMRGYIDNVRYVNIPVFGIAIDINDLGLIGGLGLVIILFLLRFSLSREIKNLNILFREAFRHDKLCDFYHSLAMQQVFTVPEMKGESKNTLLNIASKIVYFMPSAAILFAVAYDIYTAFEFSLFNFDTVWDLIFFEFSGLAFVFYLSLRCLERQLHIDEIWADYWILVKCEKNKMQLCGEKNDKRLINILEKRITGPVRKRHWWWIWLWLYIRREIHRNRVYYRRKCRLLWEYFCRQLSRPVKLWNNT